MNKSKKKILFQSKNEAESETGYFNVLSLMISSELASRIEAYILENGLCTFSQPNQAKTTNITYTLNFTLKVYHKSTKSSPIVSASHAYLSAPGALGYFKNYLKLKDFAANSGPKYSHLKISPPRSRTLGGYEDIKARTPSLNEMYFWICRKYPNELYWMDYSFTNPLDGHTKVRVGDDTDNGTKGTD